MASFNRVVLVGNLTRDPELRHIPSGMAVTEIGLAVNDRVKRGNEWVDEATFVDITLWGRTAEVACEYLEKGASVLIEGRLKLEQWDDKESGAKRSKLKVVGERLQMLGGKPSNDGGQQRSSGRKQQPSEPEDIGSNQGGGPPEDIPF